jgi:hypothetical protein
VPVRSRQFRRVSTNLQDSPKQVADLDAWDTSHGYVPCPPYVADDKSAYHGKHVPQPEQAISDMEDGQYDVLLFWASDRMWRGKSLATILGYIERLEAVSAVEFVNEVHLNNRDQDPVVRNILFANAFADDRREDLEPGIPCAAGRQPGLQRDATRRRPGDEARGASLSHDGG